MATYSFEEINERVPIEDVLALHGIYPNSKGWYSLRSEDDTPSAHIDKNKRYGNTIHDFGVSNTFNPISLTMFLRDVDAYEASQILGETFGLTPISKNKTTSDVVSDWEWCKIGVQPDMASKNMDFFPEKYGEERTRTYAEKYRMSVNELRKEDSSVYERVVRSRAIPYVLDLKNSYYRALYSWNNLNKALNIESKIEDLIKNEEISELAKDLSLAEEILKKAIKRTSITFKTGVYNVKSDFYKVVEGKISFEIGKDSHYDIKCAAFQDKVKPYYCLVSLDDYNKLVENGLENMRFSAFQKGEEVNLVFLPTDSNRFLFLLKSLRGKEFNVNKDNVVVQDLSKEALENVEEDVVVSTSKQDGAKEKDNKEPISIN